jgi:hypothetical protein
MLLVAKLFILASEEGAYADDLCVLWYFNPDVLE